MELADASVTPLAGPASCKAGLLPGTASQLSAKAFEPRLSHQVIRSKNCVENPPILDCPQQAFLLLDNLLRLLLPLALMAHCYRAAVNFTAAG